MIIIIMIIVIETTIKIIVKLRINKIMLFDKYFFFSVCSLQILERNMIKNETTITMGNNFK